MVVNLLLTLYVCYCRRRLLLLLSIVRRPRAGRKYILKSDLLFERISAPLPGDNMTMVAFATYFFSFSPSRLRNNCPRLRPTLPFYYYYYYYYFVSYFSSFLFFSFLFSEALVQAMRDHLRAETIGGDGLMDESCRLYSAVFKRYPDLAINGSILSIGLDTVDWDVSPILTGDQLLRAPQLS